MPAILGGVNHSRFHEQNNNGENDCSAREKIVQRAARIKQEITQGITKQFRDVIQADVPDPAVFSQKPITFIRQVTALSCLPELLNDSSFPSDAKARVRNFLQHCRGNSIGSLTDVEGLELVRHHIAEYIQHRDDCPAHYHNIIIVPGVSAVLKILNKVLHYSSSEQSIGVLTPVPEFQEFTGVLSEFGIKKVGYYLREDDHWSINVEELEEALVKSKGQCHLRALLVVNPGNPTGHVLRRESMEEIVKFAYQEKLLIIACEVYQDSIYNEKTFHSFKKVVFEMGQPYNRTEVLSLMSCPKGYSGESSLRAGYMELHNISPFTKELLRNGIFIADTPPICAQIALDCMVNPPKPGQPSYSLFHEEKLALLSYVRDRAQAVFKKINNIPGLSCHLVEGAFYAFVKVDMPKKAIETAKQLRQCPSTLYVLEMLEQCGVLVLPGEEFGQKPGSYHFRLHWFY